MNKLNKIIIFFYVFLAASYGFYVMTYSEGLDENLFEVVLPKKVTEFEITRIVDVPNNKIFNVMADIENFPKVIPENILSVDILDKTNNEIIAEEELSEAGLKIKLLVKHTITPYNEHVIEILDGDAKGTIITQSFEPVGSQTLLITNVNLNLQGAMSIFAFFPESNLIHALNTVISHFVEYSKYNMYERIVDSLYREILHRSADDEGLLHYSTLLQNAQITEEDLRIILSTSEEKDSMKLKSIDELDVETINVVNNLYQKVLLRDADPEGLLYFGNLFENGVTYNEIRTMLLDSDEAGTISLTHLERSTIITTYRLLFDRFPEKSEVDYYYEMSDDGTILVPDWFYNVLSWRQDSVISEIEASNVTRYLYNEGIIVIDEIPSNHKLLPHKNLEK